MGFRLSNFIGGMMEGAVELEETVRKRNEKLIDTSLDKIAERNEDILRERRAAEKEYKLLAKHLSSYPGMTKAKVYSVLNYGPDVAKAFIANAPDRAKKDGLTVGDYVDLMDSDAINAKLNLGKAIEQGNLPGMPKLETYQLPKGLLKSPVFGRDPSDYANKRAESYLGALGLTPGEEPEPMNLPKGEIKFMDLLEEKASGKDKFTPNQVLNQLMARTANMLDVGYTVDRETGTVVIADDDKELANKAEAAAYAAYGKYYESLGTQFDVETEQVQAIENALIGVLAQPVVEVGNGGTRPIEQVEQEEQAVQQNLLETSQSPAVLAQVLFNQANASGKPITMPEAQAKAKQILDKRKANAQ
jgi:hypothetical protein